MATTNPDRIAIADARTLTRDELAALAKRFVVQTVGPFWRINRSQAGPNLVAWRYVERQPKPLEWLFLTGTDLVRTIGPEIDQFSTWEWADALDLDVASPSAAPGTFEELRVAHNVAVARHDDARASALRARVLSKIRAPVRYDYTDDVHLLGVDIDDGAATVVTLIWETGLEFQPIDSTFNVACTLVQKPWLWPAPIDISQRDAAPVAPIRPSMWKPGHIYSQRIRPLAPHREGDLRGHVQRRRTEARQRSQTAPAVHPPVTRGRRVLLALLLRSRVVRARSVLWIDAVVRLVVAVVESVVG